MRSVLLGLVLTLGSVGAGQSLDLVNGTLEVLPLCASNLDDIVDLLGRPTAVFSPQPLAADFLGPTTHFHQLGLAVYFQPATSPEPGKEAVQRAVFYLVRTWDEDNAEWYSQFAGPITQQVEDSWRVSHTLAAFEGYDVEDLPPERNREWYDAALVQLGMAPSPASQVFPHSVEVRLDEHMLLFDFEPVARFLESAAILCYAPE